MRKAGQVSGGSEASAAGHEAVTSFTRSTKARGASVYEKIGIVCLSTDASHLLERVLLDQSFDTSSFFFFRLKSAEKMLFRGVRYPPADSSIDTIDAMVPGR